MCEKHTNTETWLTAEMADKFTKVWSKTFSSELDWNIIADMIQNYERMEIRTVWAMVPISNLYDSPHGFAQMSAGFPM